MNKSDSSQAFPQKPEPPPNVQVREGATAPTPALSPAIQATWRHGFIAGLREYAWWKDGVQYVGSCGTTLQEAIKRAE